MGLLALRAQAADGIDLVLEGHLVERGQRQVDEDRNPAIEQLQRRLHRAAPRRVVTLHGGGVFEAPVSRDRLAGPRGIRSGEAFVRLVRLLCGW